MAVQTNNISKPVLTSFMASKNEEHPMCLEYSHIPNMLFDSNLSLFLRFIQKIAIEPESHTWDEDFPLWERVHRTRDALGKLPDMLGASDRLAGSGGSWG